MKKTRQETLYKKIIQKRVKQKLQHFSSALIGVLFLIEIKDFVVQAILSLFPGHTLQLFWAT